MKNGIALGAPLLMAGVVLFATTASGQGAAGPTISPEVQAGGGYRSLVDISAFGFEGALGLELRNRRYSTCGLVSLQAFIGRTREGLAVYLFSMPIEVRLRSDDVWVGLGLGPGSMYIARVSDSGAIHSLAFSVEASLGADLVRSGGVTIGATARLRSTYPFSWGPTLGLLARF